MLILEHYTFFTVYHTILIIKHYKINVMKNLFKSSVLLSVFAIAIAFNPTPVKANGHEFDLTVKHNINGISLGLDKELAVDVYVNGGKAFTFSFGETVETSLEEGNYFIEVKLAGTDVVVMSYGPGDIPGGVDVMIKAQLSGGKTPVLKVKVK
jgi:hypothetical protein